MAVLHTSATFVSSDKKVRALDGGADAYLTQPFEAAELIATVKSRLRLRHVEQAARLRAEELAETGYGGPEGQDRAPRAGFDPHLVKPVKPDELERLLSAL